MPVDPQAVLECIATVVKVFEVQRLALCVVGQTFDAHDWRTGFDVERTGQVAVSQHCVNGQIGVAEGDAAVVFEDQKDVASDQIRLLQSLADRFRQVGDFQRDRLAVDQAHAFDLRDDFTFGHLQTLGDTLVGRNEFETAQSVDHFITAPGHRLGEALQAADVLKGFRLGDKGALAMDLEDQPFLLQITECTAHGDAADFEQRTQFAFGRHLTVLRVFTVENPRTEHVAQLGVQRNATEGENVIGHRRITCYNEL